MENFRFTLFNALTLLVMALTAGLAALRFTRGPRTNWAVLYYVLLAGHAAAFSGGFNLFALGAGALCEALIRWTGWGHAVRWLELGVFAYVLWRGTGLILLW